MIWTRRDNCSISEREKTLVDSKSRPAASYPKRRGRNEAEGHSMANHRRVRNRYDSDVLGGCLRHSYQSGVDVEAMTLAEVADGLPNVSDAEVIRLIKQCAAKEQWKKYDYARVAILRWEALLARLEALAQEFEFYDSRG